MFREVFGMNRMYNRVKPYKVLKGRPASAIPVVCRTCNGVVHFTMDEVTQGSKVTCTHCGAASALSATALGTSATGASRMMGTPLFDGAYSEFPPG